jgi:integrase
MRGSITKRPNGAWHIVVEAGRDPVTGRRRRTVRDVRGLRRDAEAVLAKLLVDVGGGHHLGHDCTVAEMVEAWFARAELGAATRRDCRSLIDRHLPAWLGSMKIHKVRPHHLDTAYAAMTVGPQRIRHFHSVLSRSFGQAVKYQWIASNPARDATPPSPPAPRPTPPPPDVVRRLLAAADGDLVAFLVLSATLGARRGEIVALRWSDVDLDGGSISIRRALTDGGPGIGIVTKPTKTGRERTVAVDPATISVLRTHRATMAARAVAVGSTLGPWVFALDAEGTTPWRPDSATSRFKHLRSTVGVEGVQLRELRHFVATQLLAAGVDPRTVAGRLGHARTSTTLDIYAAFVPARDQHAAAIIGDVLGHDPGKGIDSGLQVS